MKSSTEQLGVDISIVLGYIATKDIDTVEKKIAILSSLGFKNADMAKICGKKETVIATLKSRLKKGK